MNTNEKLEQIKVSLRHTIELADKATQGSWEAREHEHYPGFSVLQTPDWSLSLVTVATDLTQEQYERRIESLDFIAHARTFAPVAAKALLTVLDGLERLSRLQHNDGELCHELETICREWPEDAK